LADLIRDACINVGFFYIKNHGIPEEIFDNTVSAARKFFDLPLSEKQKLDIHGTSNFKGYTALLGENTDVKGAGDLHEGFDLGWEPERSSDATGQGLVNSTVMSGDNVWPSQDTLPAHSFKDPVLTY
jgi:isopenicillin N synthase-like dioxygenase